MTRARLATLSLKGGAILLAVLAGLILFVYWRAADGGVSLSFLNKIVESKIEARLADGSDVSVKHLYLVRDDNVFGGSGPVQLVADQVSLKTADGSELIQLPRLAIRLELSDLMQGRLHPHFIDLLNASLIIKRLEDGRYNIGLNQNTEQLASEPGAQANERPTVDVDFLRQLLGDPADIDEHTPDFIKAFGLFEGARLTDATVIFDDALTNTHWSAVGVQVLINRTPDGFAAEMDAPVELKGEITNIRLEAMFDRVAEQAKAFLIFNDAPVADIMALVFGRETAERFQAKLTGTMEIVTDLMGNVEAARFDLKAQNGTFNFADQDTPFSTISATSIYRPENRSFEIESFEYEIDQNKATGQGTIRLEPFSTIATQQPEKIIFDLDMSEIGINLPKIFSGYLDVMKAKVAGVFDVSDNILAFETVDIEAYEAAISGQFSIGLPTAPGERVGIEADMSLTGVVTLEEVLRGWPVQLAPLSRGWVARNIHAGKVTDVSYQMSLPRGYLGQGMKMSDDMMTLAFTIEEAEATYIPGLKTLTAVTAQGKVFGDGLEVQTSQGRVGNIKLLGGSVEMPSFRKGTDSIFQARVEGDVTEMLALVDMEPLGFISAGGFSATDFSGQGNFEISLHRPLKLDVKRHEMTYAGQGTFTGLGLESFIPDTDLENGVGTISVDTKNIKINGNAVIKDNPVTISWHKQLSGKRRTDVSAKGMMSASTGDTLGLPLRQFLRGEVPYTLTTHEIGGEYQELQISVDLSPASVEFTPVEWQKKVGSPGGLVITALPPRQEDVEKVWHISQFELDTEDFKVAGELDFSFAKGLLGVKISQFFLQDKADLQFTAGKNAKGVFAFDLLGKYLNAGPYIETLLNAQRSDTDQQGKDQDLKGNVSNPTIPVPEHTHAEDTITIKADLDRLTLREGVSVDDFNLTAELNRDIISDLSFTGAFQEGRKIQAVSIKNPSLTGNDLTLYTDDLGLLMQGVFGISSVKEGTGVLRATLLDDGPVSGSIEGRDFTIVGAPLIARIFSAGSFEGLSKLINNEGIEITDLSADIFSDDGVLTLENARAAGPSVGVSVAGDIDYAQGTLDLNGAIAPVYQVNSVLGNIPGLGDLFVSRKGEGVVAFAYNLKGPSIEPTVQVNALSALTPGIFRRIFEPVRADKPATKDLLKEAMEIVAEQENLKYAPSAEQIIELEKSLDQIVPEDLLPEIPEAE